MFISKMPPTAQSDIIKSFLPIFYVSKVFGCSLYPLSRPLDASNVNASLRATDVLFCLIHFALYVLVFIPLAEQWDSYDKVFSNEFASDIGSAGMVVVVFLGNILTYAACIRNLIIIVMDMKNSVNIRRVMLSFTDFDTQMFEEGIEINNASHRRIPLFYGLTTLLWQFPTIWLSLAISEGTKDTRRIFIVATYLGHAVLDGCLSSYLTTFWYILANLTDRFCAVNKCLRKLVTDTDGRMHFSNGNPFVRNLSIYHLKLTETVETVSHANAVQFILCTASFFLSLTVTVFMTYQVGYSSIEYGTPASAAYFSVRLFHEAFLLYKTMSVGSKVRKEKNNSQSLISKAFASGQNRAVSLQFNHLSYQIGHSKMVISCGIFTIDWTLLYTLAAATATYLLLFVSFNSFHAPN